MATMVDRICGAGHTKHARRAGAGDGPGLPPGWSGFRSERIGSIGTRLLNHAAGVNKHERWRPVEGGPDEWAIDAFGGSRCRHSSDEPGDNLGEPRAVVCRECQCRGSRSNT